MYLVPQGADLCRDEFGSPAAFPEEGTGMRMEGHDRRQQARAVRLGADTLQYRLMAKVDAVKIAYGHRAWALGVMARKASVYAATRFHRREFTILRRLTQELSWPTLKRASAASSF